MDEQEYLQPGFDPSTLTMPRLRSILVAHSVAYPASAKKGQLVDIFNKEIVPQSSRLRRANERVKRTSAGIEDVSAVKDEEDDVEEEIAVGAARTPARTPRRTTRARTEEAEELPLPSRSVRHSTAPPESAHRRASSKHARSSDLETIASEPEPKRSTSSKRTKHSTPMPKEEPEDERSFSTDNVFQSGSSPTQPSARRKTTGTSTSRTRTQDVRRRTEVPQYAQQAEDVTVPSRRTFDMPAAQLKQELQDDIEPTEEFVPEEQALVAQDQQSRALAVRPKSKSPAGGVAKTGLSATLLVLLATFSGLWAEEKFKVGYCGVGHASHEIRGVEIPEWADAIRPACEPCPPHAYCHSNLETVCEPGFVLTQNPLSLGGVLPFAPSCEPDTARTRKIEAVKQRAVEELREQNAKYECGEAPKPGMQENDLKRALATRKRRDMSNEEFEDLWASALGELHSVEEISSGTDGLVSETQSSDLPPSHDSPSPVPSEDPFAKQLDDIYKLLENRSTDAKAKDLAGLALRKLSEQASLHVAEPERWEEGYISVAQLRDDVLREEFSATRRKKIWEKVQKKVEGNANVRPMVREGRSGDVGRVWEWVGAVGAIEAPPTDRRRSSYFDCGMSTPDDRRLLEHDSRSSRQSFGGKVVRWQEPQQYY